jgi:hypothetical protein
MSPEERPDLQDYKSKDKVTPSATGKKTDFTSVTTVPTPEGDYIEGALVIGFASPLIHMISRLDFHYV